MLVMKRPSLTDSKGRRNCDTNTDGGMVNTDGLDLWNYLHLHRSFSFDLDSGGIALYNIYVNLPCKATVGASNRRKRGGD